jgi:electron transfer flavoprotein beta subunit
MPYNSVVLIKQVPDTANITGKAMKSDGTVNRAALPAIMNPEDLNALEMALQVKEKHGGTVTALTMGPPRATEVLREALYRGADQVILLTDRKTAGSDTLATSYALTRAVQRIVYVDLVFCGRQAIDGDTAQVGPQVAEKLGLPQVTYAEALESLQGSEVVVRRALPLGTKWPEFETEEALERYLDKGGQKITVWNAADIGAELERVGLSGSPTKVLKVDSVVLLSNGSRQFDPSSEGMSELVLELVHDYIL